MAAVARLEVTPVFADDTSVKITIDNIKPENISSGTQIENIRSRVMQFNAQQGGDLATKMKSKNGFNWVAIKKVQIVTTNKQVIF